MNASNENLGRQVRVYLTALQKWVITGILAILTGASVSFWSEAKTAFNTIEMNKETARKVKIEQERRAGVIAEIVKAQERISENQILLYCDMQDYHDGEKCHDEFVNPPG